MSTLRLATRGSDLATTQSRWAAAAIEAATGRATELVIVKTVGDRRTDTTLADVGSVGLFTKEVQDALLDGRADYAVHSLKDLPAEQTPGLVRAAVPVRVDARDWLLVRPDALLEEGGDALVPLAAGARVGTSAARRAAFLRAMAPQVEPLLLRGNVPTRVQRLRDGDYEAILLAGAGLSRLDFDLEGLEVRRLDPVEWPGAPGQGALALECRADDAATLEAVSTIHDPAAADSVEAERSLLRLLGGGCGLPLGAYAVAEDGGWRLHAALGPTAEGQPLLRRAESHAATPADAAQDAFEALGDA